MSQGSTFNKITVHIWILQFFLQWKASLSCNRTLISLSWLSDGRMFIKSYMRISLIPLKNWHPRKKCNTVSVSMLQGSNRFKVPSKWCWNSCSHKWVNPNLNLVSSFFTNLVMIVEDFIFTRSNNIWQTFAETVLR